MKLHRPTKIVLGFMVLLILGFAIFITANYGKLKNQSPSSVKLSGTCAPDVKACETDPKLCMELNKNQVCD